jgi:hypothetical protein
MFKEEYILDLLSGQLTQKGYASIVGSIGSMVRRYHWQKNIVVSGCHDSNWSDDDIIELSQQFFEWLIINGKLKYVDKVPYDYLSYYFTQMLVSFVSIRIKKEQQKVGISFQRCQELVKDICEESYTTFIIAGKVYIGNNSSSSDVPINDLSEIIRFLPHYIIKPTTKHYKPLVKMIVDDIMADLHNLVSLDLLTKTVFNLLDQSALQDLSKENDSSLTNQIEEHKYDSYIQTILDGITKKEAQMLLEYIFQDSARVSLSDISNKYGIPKSTVSKKINDFKKKIFVTYMPENELDGECFLKKLAYSLDELSISEYNNSVNSEEK